MISRFHISKRKYKIIHGIRNAERMASENVYHSSAFHVTRVSVYSITQVAQKLLEVIMYNFQNFRELLKDDSSGNHITRVDLINITSSVKN